MDTNVKIYHRYSGNCVKSSRGLRGILDYARKCPVVYADVLENSDHRASVSFSFDYDNPYMGAYCIVSFSDASVARQWLLSRKSWGIPAVETHGVLTTYKWAN